MSAVDSRAGRLILPGDEQHEPKRDALLAIEDLHVDILTKRGRVRAVDGVTLTLDRGETLAVVGESGSGKTMTFHAALGLLKGRVEADVRGSVRFDGADLFTMNPRNRRTLLGPGIAMVFQNPLSALNPVVKVGAQIAETVRVHEQVSRRQARKRAVEALSMARMPRPQEVAGSYPHELSGGMRQRALIAMAIACRPSVLVADEPTTALDVTIQAEILQLLDTLRSEMSMGLILITHDLGVVSQYASRVAVMYGGRVVEELPADRLLDRQAHPYTAALLRSVPTPESRRTPLAAIAGEPPNLMIAPQGCSFRSRCAVGHDREICRDVEPNLDLFVNGSQRSACHFVDELQAEPRVTSERSIEATPSIGDVNGDEREVVLRAENLVKEYRVRGARGRSSDPLRAVDDVSLTLRRGETLGIVGESGSGKSTLARMLLRLVTPTSGRIWLDGHEITSLESKELRAARELIQVVFQDPQGALDPRMTVEAIIAEPLVVHGQWKDGGPKRVRDMLKAVGLSADHADRYPKELSGGQQQRVGIARALVLRPRVLILDEPTSALDVSIRAQILNLLMDLQNDLGITYVFIAHDLAVINHVSDRIAVMYQGRIVELGAANDVYNNPVHPYTRSLLAAIPRAESHADEVDNVDRALPLLEGHELKRHATGCPFHLQCPRAARIGAALSAGALTPTGGRPVPVECVEDRPTWVVHEEHGVECHFTSHENDPTRGLNR